MLKRRLFFSAPSPDSTSWQDLSSPSFSMRIFHALKSRPSNSIAAIYLLVLAALCFSSGLFVPYAWDEIHFVSEATGPSWQHWFGIDDLGRDLFSRVLYGGRISLSVGLMSTSVSVLIGISYGAIAGYFGGTIDRWMMRLVDVLYCLPYYFVIVLVMVLFSIDSLYLLFVVLALFQWLGMARIIRGQVLSLKEQEFVLALRGMGASHARIVFRHMVPNTLGIASVYATLMVPGVMMQEAFLSFIGIPFTVLGTDGVHKPVASWGSLLSEGARYFDTAPWLLIFPAFFFSTTLLAIHFLGDGLRDALDPSLKV